MKRALIWLPLGLFGVFSGGRGRADAARRHDGAFDLGRQAASRFQAEPMVSGKPDWRAAISATGKPRLLNVFASWCIPCIAERAS